MKRRPLVASLVSCLTASLILAAGCGEQSPTATRLEPTGVAAARAGVGKRARAVRTGRYLSKDVTALITPAGGTLDFGIGRIEFPQGAVEHPIWISARASHDRLAVALQPHGLSFPAGHEPVLSFRHRGFPANSRVPLVLYVDDTQRILEVLPTAVDNERQVYTTQLRHFSGYLLGSW